MDYFESFGMVAMCKVTNKSIQEISVEVWVSQYSQYSQYAPQDLQRLEYALP